MNIEAFNLESPPTTDGRALRMVAKRYRNAGRETGQGVTLLMLHAMGQHKEQWEPTIEKLYAVRSGRSNESQIREVWAFDWQSHGESAVINAESLRDNPKATPLDLWASAIAMFIKSDLVKDHNLVAIGHSSGTVGVLLSTTHFQTCPYVGIILVEPSMMDKETWNTNHEEIQAAFDMVSMAIKHRRDVWTDKEAAQKYFVARFPWNTWDARIVQLFSEHGLYSSKDKCDNDCVMRKCPMIHEASAFEVNLEITWSAAEQISKLSGTVPIHVVFGETVDLMPQIIRDCVVDKEKGRKVDSVTTVPNVGHTIVQELPDIVGSTISNLLDLILITGRRSHF